MLAWFLARLRAVPIPPPRPAPVRIARPSGAASRRPLRRRTINL